MAFNNCQHEIVSLDATDTLHCDNLLNKFKLQPRDLMVILPSYFVREREDLIKEVRNISHLL